MSTPAEQWDTYVATELPKVASFLAPYHIILNETQPHTKGERFLMQALTTVGGKKLILLGTDTKTNKRVVVKATSDPAGKEELIHERACRALLHSMRFSYESFHSPLEIYFFKREGYIVYVSEYIEQSSSFLERPLEEQFDYALRALKAQEQTRATTAGHFRSIHQTFGNRTAKDYLAMFDAFVKATLHTTDQPSLHSSLTLAHSELEAGQLSLMQYGGFLTHTDFVPHNFRIRDNILYLLDFSSLRFGNKHESWARFLNFMTLYNPELETLLLSYVAHNRSPEEQASLHLMRLFRLGEIITYYSRTLEKSTGNLLELNQARINFWNEVLRAELQRERVDREIVNRYCAARDRLRTADERERQIGLH